MVTCAHIIDMFRKEQLSTSKIELGLSIIAAPVNMVGRDKIQMMVYIIGKRDYFIAEGPMADWSWDS